MVAMLLAAVSISLAAILIALLVGVLIYAIGVYVFHAPQPLVGIVALVVFLLLLLSNPIAVK